MADFPNEGSFWNLLNAGTMGSESTSNSQFPGFSSQAPMTPEQQAFLQSQQQAFLAFQQTFQNIQQNPPQQQSQSSNSIPQQTDSQPKRTRVKHAAKRSKGKEAEPTGDVTTLRWSSDEEALLAECFVAVSEDLTLLFNKNNIDPTMVTDKDPSSSSIISRSEKEDVIRAVEIVERNSIAIAERFSSLFSSLSGTISSFAFLVLYAMKVDNKPEILEVLAAVCESHNFPLAQTWVPCRHRSVLAYGGGFKKSCSSFDGSCMGQVCMSTTDVAFYVVDAHMWGFREACAEHHLQKGQGVTGRAFETRSSCFCENITHFSKTEYPLVHYARLLGLVASFAICLSSSHTGNDDYILEFFLPPNMVDCNDQQTMLGSLLTSMKQHFRSFTVASGEQIGEDGRLVEIIKASVNGDVIDSGLQSIRLSESKSERKRGKAEKSFSLEVLQQHFAGNLKDAAKNLGVCPTTMKRICRQHGISRWPSCKINKVNRSLTKLKRVIESVQGGEGTFTVPSLQTTQIPRGVDSTSWPTAPNGSPTNQQGSPGSKTYPTTSPKNKQGPTNQTSGSREASTGSPNSPNYHRSCQESQPYEVKAPNPAVEFSVSDALLAAQTEEPFRGMLIKDAGSSHDLTNLFLVAEPLEKVQELTPKVQPFRARTDMKTITIKASYIEDMTRFRMAANSGIIALKEEVAKRLKLDVGTFDIKYLDDDQEWVPIVCDADLQECVELSVSSRTTYLMYLAELLKKKKQVGSASSSGIFTIELFAFPNKSWVYDTGCGTNICITKQGFREARKLKQRALYLYVGNGVRAQVEAIGN
ncbi:NIN like protein 7 [Tanacetum coccineum]|uniref:NIN like protein 7 n=1 Tax=Tanacetum coccineum TaxID=301880 RepID=A0ABQ5F4H6_9ASTR